MPDDLSPARILMWPRKRRACCSSTTPRRRATTGSTSRRSLGLSRLRGVQCRSQHAESFIVEKATVTFERC